MFASGTVGIGVTNPSATLHVNGTLSTGTVFYPNAPSQLGTEGGFIVSKLLKINTDATVSPVPIQVFENGVNITRMGSLLTISGYYNINSNSSTYAIRFTNRMGFTNCDGANLVWAGSGSYISSVSMDTTNNWLIVNLSGVPSSGVQYITLNCVIVLGEVVNLY